jgi:hypothetical protein
MAKMSHDDVAQDKKMVKKAFRMHDDQMHEGKKTNMKGLKKGGPTSMDRKKFGKNMSRAMNQKGSSRGK